MSKVRVVRIEKNGIGPFQGLSSMSKLYGLMYDHLSNSGHLSCTVARPDDYKSLSGYLFACINETELHDYFGDEDVEYMLSIGYKIKEYFVEESKIMYGMGELAFLPTEKQLSTSTTHDYPLLTINTTYYPAYIDEATDYSINVDWDYGKSVSVSSELTEVKAKKVYQLLEKSY